MKTRIRMYRQGLGDCFVIRLDAAGTTRSILVDCGVILGTPGATARMNQVVAEITAEVGAKIDYVVATHEHWDHLSGFVQAKDAFDKLAFGEIWFAWTEAPEDALAKSLRADRKTRRENLAATVEHWKGLKAGTDDGADPTGAAARIAMTESVLAFFGGDAGDPLGVAAGTGDAMNYLKSRKEHKRYLDPGTTFTLPDMPDVRVFVLGPPRDLAFIRKTLPSKKGPETYDDAPLTLAATFFAAAAENGVELEAPRGDAGLHPFDEDRRLDPRKAAPTDEPMATYDAPDAAWRRIDHDWLDAAADLAIALDDDTNNTSLVLALELGPGGDVLLLPGDAQVGSWLSWMDMTFNVSGRGSVTAQDLLARAVFYKVGHHASHNATLRDKGLERMVHRDLHAMVPVDSEMAIKKRWGQMPFKPLLARLIEKTRGRVIQSDKGLPDAATLERLDATERERFATFRQNELYIDITFG